MTSLALVTRLGMRTLLPSCRRYATKTSRTPLRVLSPEDAADSDRLRRFRPVVEDVESPSTSRAEAPAKEEEDENEVPFLESKPRLPPGFPPYEKKGRDDTILSRFVLNTNSDKRRKKVGLIMLEGSRLIEEALLANIKLKALFFSRVEDIVNLPLPSEKRFVFEKVVYNKIQRWSKLTTCPGIIGFFEVPNISKAVESSLPISIICDNVRDPSNLGSILRVAASAGCRTVFLTKGCADLWNDKAVRAGMGAHFHVCIKEKVDWSDLETQLEPNGFLIFADNKATYLTPEEIVHEDSLNQTENTQSLEHEPVSDRSNSKLLQPLQEWPVFPYYLVNYSAMENIYLVIGGETGISSSAVNLDTTLKRFRVNIAMMNKVESLNVTSALAILTFEIKRQYEIADKSRDLFNAKDS